MPANPSTTGYKVKSTFGHAGIMPRAWTNKIGRMLSNIQVDGADTVVNSRGIHIDIAPSAGTFSGTAYVAGFKTTGLNSDSTKPWVKVDVTTTPPTVTEEAGPPSDPFPDGEEWYEKANTAGDIHVTRF